MNMKDKIFSFDELRDSISSIIFGFEYNPKNQNNSYLVFQHNDGFVLEIFSPTKDTIYFKIKKSIENISGLIIIEGKLENINYENFSYNDFGEKINDLLLKGFNYENEYNFVNISLSPNNVQSIKEYIQEYLYNLGSIRSGDSLLLVFDEEECKISIELEYDEKDEKFRKSLGLYYKPRKNIGYLSCSDMKWSENELNNPTKFTCDLDDFKKLASIFQKFYLENWKI